MMSGVNNRFSWADQLREQGYVEFEPLPGTFLAPSMRVDLDGVAIGRRARARARWGDISYVEGPSGTGSRIEIEVLRGPAIEIRADRLGLDPTELARWLSRETWSRAPIDVPPRLVLGSDEELGPVYQKRSGHFVDLDRLGLSAQLVDALHDWDRETFDNLAYWAISQDQSVRRWEQELLPEGRRLAALMASELGPGATVEMHDDL